MVLLAILLSWLQLSAEGKPRLPARCSQTSEIERYDPTDPGAETECIKCPECPERQGLSPQCGSRAPKGTKIECIQCQANVSYSNSHGIESCKACHDCGLKNVIQHCSPDKNRICGTKCPQGYFLDDNHICQECYFCCDSASEAQRRQGCKDIGMSRDWRCEKTEQNQRCKEAFENLTTKPTDTKPTVPPKYQNTIKTQGHDKFATTGTLSVDGSTNKTIQGTNLTLLPENDDSANAAQSTTKDKEREEHGAVNLRVVVGVVSFIFIISAMALMPSKCVTQFCRFSRTKRTKPADSTELIPLTSIREHTDSGQASPQDILETEVPQLSCADNNLTTEEHEESGKEVCKPNLAAIPEDCRISEMEELFDDEGNLMLFCIQTKLDVLETLNRKTWRSVGNVLQVSSEQLDMIETNYVARRSPTESLLSLLKTREKEPTMREFVEALMTCGRHDVAHLICNWPWAKCSVPICSENPCDMVQKAAAKGNEVQVGEKKRKWMVTQQKQLIKSHLATESQNETKKSNTSAHRKPSHAINLL